MPIGIDDLDIEEQDEKQLISQDPINEQTKEIEDPDKSEQENSDNTDISDPPTNKDEKNTENINDQIISDLLKKQGIQDLHKINFEGDDGKINQMDWKDLSNEERLNILSNQEPQQESDDDIDDDEIDLINDIRSKGISPKEYINSIKEEAAKEFINNQQQQPQQYQIDNYSNDELYLLDLKSRIPDITDEELGHSLETAKQDENLFTKQMSGIRQEYKRLEDNQNAIQNAEAQEADKERKQEEFNKFSNTIIDNIDKFNDNDLDFELEDQDKQEIANFILGQDQAGVSYLEKALEDPDTLVKMAWFALKGKDALDSINDYYKNQITEIGKTNYNKGLEEGKKQISKNPKVVINHASSINNRQNAQVQTIDDLD